MNLAPIFLAIGKKYKVNLLFNLISIVIFGFLLMFIIMIKTYYSLYHAIEFGFIPDVYVEFKQLLSKTEIDAVVHNLTDRFPINLARKGRTLRKNRVYFSSDKIETIEKDLTIIGLVHEGDRRIKVFQDGRTLDCKVLNIEYLGNWTIYVDKIEGLNEGKCQLLLDKDKTQVALHVSEGTGFSMLDFEEIENSMIDSNALRRYRLFYSFLTDFVNRFTDLNYAGIDIDRFSRDNDTSPLVYAFETYQKRKILAYASLIFWESHSDIPLLLTRTLKRSISQYLGESLIQLKSEDLKLNAQVIDAINFEPEHHLEKNIILTDYLALKKYFGINEGFNVLYLYDDNLDASDISSYIQTQYPNITCLSKSQIIPRFEQQQTYVNVFLYFFYGLLFLLVFSIIFINLLNFYHLFKNELRFLKLYGFGFSVYSFYLTMSILFGYFAGGVLLNFCVKLNNIILTRYFYPPLVLTCHPVIIGIITFSVLIIITLFLEHSQEKKFLELDKGEF
jgi:hypothetical protein